MIPLMTSAEKVMDFIFEKAVKASKVKKGHWKESTKEQMTMTFFKTNVVCVVRIKEEEKLRQDVTLKAKSSEPNFGMDFKNLDKYF